MYKYFEIDHRTTLEDIKQQYRKLAMQSHPDREGGSIGQFREVNQEYRCALEEIQKRAKHSGDQNLYKVINEQLVDIDKLISRINVPNQFRPAISYLVELGINNLGNVIKQKLQ